MDWGWYVVIAIVVLLAVPLFIPLILYVRAEPGHVEYRVALGWITVLPNFSERSARWKRQWGKVFYVISRPFVWLFQALALLIRGLTWPLRALRRARANRRREKLRQQAATAPPVTPPDLDRSEGPAPRAGEFQDEDSPADDGGDGTDEPRSLDGEGEDDDEDEDEDRPAADDQRAAGDAAGGLGDEPRPMKPPLSHPERPKPVPEDEDVSEAPEEEPWPAKKPPFQHPGGPAVPPGVADEDEVDEDDYRAAPDDDREFDLDDDDWEDAPKPPPDDLQVLLNLPGVRHVIGFARQGRDGLAMLKRVYSAYGDTAKRILRALILFGLECLRQFRFRTLQLSWSTGGDPAALGQVLGWHEMVTATIHPRLRPHVHFYPQWDSEEIAPTGRAEVHLFLWPFRFVPPFVRFLWRMPWWSMIRIGWRQWRQRSQD